MIDIRDRLPGTPNQYTLKKQDGSSETVILERNDNPSVNGTLIGRKTLMAMQGFMASTTEFLADGSIKETNSDGDIMLTEFLEDGSIKETFSPSDGQGIIVKTTIFNEDGSITTEVM